MAYTDRTAELLPTYDVFTLMESEDRDYNVAAAELKQHRAVANSSV